MPSAYWNIGKKQCLHPIEGNVQEDLTKNKTKSQTMQNMQWQHGKSSHRCPSCTTIHSGPLFLSRLRTAAPEHVNACQQYVQQTCCAREQTLTTTHSCLNQVGIMDISLLHFHNVPHAVLIFSITDKWHNQ